MESLGDLSVLGDIVRREVASGRIPGAVVCVGAAGGVLWQEAFGHRAVKPRPRPMELQTPFDLASLTKPVACAASVMVLAERGRLSLADPVARYLPPFARGDKRSATIEQLLLHTGGLAADNAVVEYRRGAADALDAIIASPSVYEAGTRFLYSDLGYIVLGELVRVVAGKDLAQFARGELFLPLQMASAGFNPPPELRRKCASTARRGRRWLVGEVHDPRAHALGGVSGHAGLFATAADLANFCRMILRNGECDGRRVLAPETVAAMTAPRELPGGAGLRTYGFDSSTRFSAAWAGLFPAGTTLGHTGFTGTMIWLVPRHDRFVVLLTNVVHVSAKRPITELRARVIAGLAAALRRGA